MWSIVLSGVTLCGVKCYMQWSELWTGVKCGQE